MEWAKDGNGYYLVEAGEIVHYTLPANSKTVLISKSQLTPPGQQALQVSKFIFRKTKKSSSFLPIPKKSGGCVPAAITGCIISLIIA